MALYIATPKRRSLINPSFLHLFSTSSNHPNNPDHANDSHSDSHPPSFSSYVRDVKAHLKQQSPVSPNPTNPSFPASKPMPPSAHLDEIRKKLSDYRGGYAAPSPTQSSPTPLQSQPQTSFQEYYKRNVLAKQGDSNCNPSTSGPGSILPFDTIRQSLKQLGSNSRGGNVERKTGQSLSLYDYTESFKLKPSDDNVVFPVIGGSSKELPSLIFGREMRGKSTEGEAAMKMKFVKMYSHGELGEKLKQLRPERKEGEGWFSLQELNERLIKLREMEEKEIESRIHGLSYKDMVGCLHTLQMSEDEKKKQASIRRSDILEGLGRTPLGPPKENLVEKYFHPDNMSSAEKLKIELAKVRDEFKMSESDCGSSRVQVAQLTTKIKHLSSVLHKKDKHSRKGLQAMVQKRKKLLKYLRRTDWDSYCLVLSKLGLRDNPDYKN